MGVGADAVWGDPMLWVLSLDMVATASRSGYLTRVNPAWEVTLGYAPAELMAQPYLGFVHPDDVAATMAEVAALDSSSDQGVQFENRCRDTGGTYHRFSWHCRGAEDGVTILAVVRDVTSLRQAEAARDGFHRQLQERVQFFLSGFCCVDLVTQPRI